MTPDPLAVELARHFALHGSGQYPVCACDGVARHSPEHVADAVHQRFAVAQVPVVDRARFYLQGLRGTSYTWGGSS